MGEEAVYAHQFTGKRYDCGSKLGYLQATVEYALGHPQLGKEFAKYLKGASKLAIRAKPLLARSLARNKSTEALNRRAAGGGSPVALSQPPGD